MHNMVCLIGRLTDDVKNEEGKASITLAVQRAFKNEEGVYETDLVPIMLFGNIGSNTSEYCHKGDLMGVKGRLQVIDEKLIVVADKVSFLASKKPDEE